MDNNLLRTFRSTSVRPFKTDSSGVEQEKEKLPEVLPSTPIIVPDEEPQRNDKPDSTPKPHRLVVEIPRTKQIADLPTIDDDYDAEAFLTEKETRDRDLSIKLRAEGKITTPGKPFQLSQRTEYESLIARGVFVPIHKSDLRLKGQRIFKSRMVDGGVKGKETTKPYEKSRLVIQAFNDKGKKEILTQSPTIQRVSQRLIICMAAAIRHLQRLRHLPESDLVIRDITQAYVQAHTKLIRQVFAWPPEEIAEEFPEGTVFMVVLPLYGIPESGNHWFNTYHKHHVKNLQMETSTYDPCLLITSKDNPEIGIIGMQTDDTLILGEPSSWLGSRQKSTEPGF